MIGNQVAEDLRRCCDALEADNRRLRAAMQRLEKGFQAGRNNANAMFRESGNVYHEGRRVAYDQAASDVRAALSGADHDRQ